MKETLVELHNLGGEKASQEELDYLLSILDNVSPKFFEKLDLYVQEDAETSRGIARAKRIDIKVKGDPVVIGNQQSEASIYLEEVLHSMTKGALKSDTVKARKLKRQLDHLVELARDQLTWKDFLPKEEDSINPEVEEQFAKKLFNYIFNNKKGDYEFLAKGVAQTTVANAFKTVKIKDRKQDRTLLEILIDAIKSVFDILMDNTSIKDKKDATVHDALVRMSVELGEINTKAARKALESTSYLDVFIEWALNTPDRYLSRKLGKVGDKLFSEKRKQKYENPEDSLYGKVKHAVEVVGLSMINGEYKKAMGVMASSYGLTPDSFFRELIRNMMPTESAQKIAELLVLRSGLADKVRNKQARLTKTASLSKFKEKLSKDREEFLTDVVADTDLSSIMGKNSITYEIGLTAKSVYDNKTLRGLLSDPEKLKKKITGLKRAIKHLDNTNYTWLRDQAVGLGIYMGKNAGNLAQILHPEQIVKTVGKNKSKAEIAKLEKAVGELSVLVALENTDAIAKSEVATLMETEWEGVQHIGDILEGFKKASEKAVFKEGTGHRIKGYTKDIFDPNIIVEIAPLKEAQDLIDEGFEFVQELEVRVPGSKRNKMGLFISDGNGRPEKLRGATRLQRITSKGRTIGSSTFKDSLTYTDKQKREIAQRDILELKKYTTSIVSQMKDGSFNFNNTSFGIMPVYDTKGNIVEYRYMMDKETKKRLLRPDRRISEVISKSFGSIMDKERTRDHNNDVLKALKKDMKENWLQGSKGIDGLTEFTLIGPNSSDPEMKKLYAMLPREFQEFIQNREDKTLAVRSTLMDIYFGYTHGSIMDIKALNEITPKHLETLIRGFGNFWVDLVEIAKTNILLKIPAVIITNVFTNYLMLFIKGYSPAVIHKELIESFKIIKKYNRDQKEQQRLINEKGVINAALSRDNLSESRKKRLIDDLNKLNGKLAKVTRSVEGSRVHELAEMGVDQSYEDFQPDNVNENNKVAKWGNTALDMLPGNSRAIVDWTFITQRTPLYGIANELLASTDFVFRDMQNTIEKRREKEQAKGDRDLPDWWLEGKPEGYRVRQELDGKEKVEFLKKAEEVRKFELVEDYINYAMPSTRNEEYLNRIGILMFSKFPKRIQKIIARTGSRGPIKTAIGLSVTSNLDLPSFHDASFLAREWYTDSLGPGNLLPFYSPLDILGNVFIPPVVRLVADPY
jgi:hypothetical protein